YPNPQTLAELVFVDLLAAAGQLLAGAKVPADLNVAFPLLKEAAPSPSVSPPERRPHHLDDNVQFTVYRPRFIALGAWYPLLAFAHLSERPPGAPAHEPDPLAEVERQARQVL